jgi:transposase-like protein
MESEPKTLQEAILFFSDLDNCQNYMIAKRYPHGIYCPTCGRQDVRYLAKQRRWECKASHPKKQFSIKVGTIFEDSPIGLDKWLAAVWMITNAKNGVSSWEIHRSLGVTQKTAWFMLHRVRLGMQDTQTGGKLSGEVEIDETFIGGKARNMHPSAKEKVRHLQHRNSYGKTVVFGMLERKGRVRMKVVQRRKRNALMPDILANVEKGSQVFTDAFRSYGALGTSYEHQVIDHAESYVRGNIHTNGLENFWSLLKRGIRGTYVSVEPFHVFRYVDEQVFRFNERKLTDSERFDLVLTQLAGKRVTYEQLTGKQQEGVRG